MIKSSLLNSAIKVGIVLLASPTLSYAQRFITPTHVAINAHEGQVMAGKYQFENNTQSIVFVNSAHTNDKNCKVQLTHGIYKANQAGTIRFECHALSEKTYRHSVLIQFNTGVEKELVLSGTVYPELENPCSDIRLDAKGGSMEKIVEILPNVAQIGGSCSFHTAAQMYDAWRFQHATQNINDSDQMSSPVVLDFEIKKQNKQKNLSGGNINNNLQYLFKKGSCPRKYFNETTGRNFDEEMYDKFYYSFNHTKDANDLIRLVYNKINLKDFYEFNPNPDMGKVMTSILLEDFVSFIAEVIPPRCDSKERLRTNIKYKILNRNFSAEIFGFYWHNSDSVKREINNELDQGISKALPVGISYCSTVLNEGKNFEEIKSTNEDSGCGNHASMIIGRRKNRKTGACEFLLRNSWRAGYTYSRSWESDVGKSQVWIDADTLSDSIYATTRMVAD